MDRAIDYYKKVISNYPRDKNLDRVKIILGDAYLIKNQLNLASNTYMSVTHKNFKNLAEYKNAELEFFKANFKQALQIYNNLILQTQPSDSLVNNVLARQILINRFSIDSLSLANYAHAELLFFQHKLTESIDKLSELALNKLKISPFAGIKAGKILLQINKFEESRELLSELKESYSEDTHIDEIIFLLAQCEEHLGNPDIALKLYQ